MNAIARNLKQRLSLREPLQESLDIVAELAGELELSKTADLVAELEKVRSRYPTCTAFERDFVSLAFAIATGVGKTRLMGAIVAYLYLKKGIRNFFILAPNLTIYEKLVTDFGQPGSAKYVFAGIPEFVNNPPVVINGDNYAQNNLAQQGGVFAGTEVRINIFNIAKFNADSKGSRQKGVALPPRIKRLSEYLGQSYWEYLTALPDLVILMDEAHRYHAHASKAAINELKPVLGIELTATPLDEKGRPFKNVVYEYSLAQALTDGKFVKNPAIATRKNFRKEGLTEREIEVIKLEDAVSLHTDTKTELELYARTEGKKLVKPFILVVCQNIAHAGEILELLNSAAFHGGRFAGRVLQIDSSTRREEDIEAQFVALESPDSEIEIVIHVNMLKEGWDVTNLYTIVPLRAADAPVLVEQTIGRGLRLPFEGKRTGIDKLDKLTVIAHDNFDLVIKAAQDPNSVLSKMRFITLGEDDFKPKTEVVTAPPVMVQQQEEEQKKVDQITDVPQKAAAQTNLDARRLLGKVLPRAASLPAVRTMADLAGAEVKETILAQAEKELAATGNLFAPQVLEEARLIYETEVATFKAATIEIPRIVVEYGETQAEFLPFDLDTTGFNYTTLNEEIIRMDLLKQDDVEVFRAQSSGAHGTPVDQLVSELLNFSDVDYGANADLLHHLAAQACAALIANGVAETDLSQTVYSFKRAIARRIYDQMKVHFVLHQPQYANPKVLPFRGIESWNFSVGSGGYRSYRDNIMPLSSIPKTIFTGFQKAGHAQYKFDSKAEQDLAFVLEADSKVEKWLRPAPLQFSIYWGEGSSRYEPDFVVETATTIFLVEVKRADQVAEATVQAKREAAERYCAAASHYTAAHGGKPWRYLLLPHSEIGRTFGWDYLVGRG